MRHPTCGAVVLAFAGYAAVGAVVYSCAIAGWIWTHARLRPAGRLRQACASGVAAARGGR